MNGPEPAARAALAAVIEHDLEAIERLALALEALPADANYAACAGAAYALHNLYNALENSFEQISRTFENHVVDRDQWHRELMLSQNSDPRPSAISAVGPSAVHGTVGGQTVRLQIVRP